MTPEEEAKAQERRARHLEQLRTALPADFNAPPRPSPFASARQPQAPWTIGDSFTPRGLSAAAQEGARFFGDEVFRPATEAVNRGVGAVSRGVEQWNQNRMARDRAEADLSARYMPQIRAANAGTQAAMDEYAARSGRMEKRVGELTQGNAINRRSLEQNWQHPFMREEPNAYPALSSGPGRRLPPPGGDYRAPEHLSDDELLAELAALEGGQQ